MSGPYRLPPGMDRSMERTLDSLRRQLDSSGIQEALQRQNQVQESISRYFQDLESQRPIFETLKVSYNSPVAEAILALEAYSSEFRSQIQRTIAPLPDLSLWHDVHIADYLKLHDSLQNFDSISRAVERAKLLWGSELPEFEPAQEESEDHPREPPSEQLLRTVPADALTRLQTVDSLPLKVLDRIYRAPKAIHQLTPRQFEQLVAEILEELGFDGIELTPRSGDKGRDVVALKQVNGIPVIFAFECKHQAPHRKVGVGVVRALLGTVTQISTRANVGVLVTTSTFTRGAQNFFLTEATVKGRDFDGVVEWMEEIERLRRGA